MTEDPVVFLATAANEPLALMWADVLNEAGIRAVVKPEGPGVGAWGSAFALEHALFVLRSRHAEAAAIVAALDREG